MQSRPPVFRINRGDFPENGVSYHRGPTSLKMKYHVCPALVKINGIGNICPLQIGLKAQYSMLKVK